MTSEQFNLDYFKDIVAQSKDTLSVNALLATEQRIPGLGNGVLQDILFDAKINPIIKIKELSSQEIEQLDKSIKKIVPTMIQQGSRDVEKDLYATEDGYKTILSSKAVKRTCPICGSPIVKEAFLGGSVYYCPVCQPKK